MRPPGARISDALHRQWLMLRLIPRAPRKIDSAGLESALREQGQHIDRRSIQRDLHKLSALFPIVCDDSHKPFGWSWMRDGLVPSRLEPRGPALELRVRLRTVDGLPLDGRLSRDEDGWHLLEATAPDNVDLRRWILGEGAGVEVLAPATLREQIRRIVRDAARLYERRRG
jgi:predicted DNA-binding transcriptional regulator YafY